MNAAVGLRCGPKPPYPDGFKAGVLRPVPNKLWNRVRVRVRVRGMNII